jgi:hypothetical protein
MQFIVTQKYNNEYDVKLGYESKEKIKKFFFWTAYAAGIGIAAFYAKKNQENNATALLEE